MHPLRRSLHGFDDRVVPGTATQVSCQSPAYRVFIGMRFAVEHVDRGHDHSWRAIPALETVVRYECLLQGMQVAVAAQALDRGDFRIPEPHCEDGAAFESLTID